MKKLINFLIISTFICSTSFADCDFSTGITKLEDKYVYTKECHIKVGEMKRDLEIKDSQITDYKKAIELKDLALSKSEERADKWMSATFETGEKLSKVQELQSRNYVVYAIVGAATMALAVWGAGQLR